MANEVSQAHSVRGQTLLRDTEGGPPGRDMGAALRGWSPPAGDEELGAGVAPPSPVYRGLRKRVPPGHALRGAPMALDFDEGDGAAQTPDAHGEDLWEGRTGWPTWREKPRGRRRLSETDIFPGRVCVSEPATPRAAASVHASPRQEGVRTYMASPTHSSNAKQVLFGSGRLGEEAAASFREMFTGSAGSPTWRERARGLGRMEESHHAAESRVDAVVFGGEATAGPGGGPEAIGGQTYEGSAGLGTWCRREDLALAGGTAGRQQGLRTFASEPVGGRLSGGAGACPFGVGRNQKRQYPCAPVRTSVVGPVVFSREFAGTDEGARPQDYTGLFDGTAGGRTWNQPVEMERFRRLGKAGVLTASSPDMPLHRASSPAAPHSPTASSPRRQICRQASEGGDMRFLRNDEPLEGYQDIFSGRAGLCSWQERPQALARTSPRQAWDCVAVASARAAGVSARPSAPPMLTTASELQASHDELFRGAAGKPQRPPNDGGLTRSARGPKSPFAAVYSRIAPWA